MAHGPNPAHSPLSFGLIAKNAFYIFKGLWKQKQVWPPLPTPPPTRTTDRDHMYPLKSKIFTILSLKENICWSPF